MVVLIMVKENLKTNHNSQYISNYYPCWLKERHYFVVDLNRFQDVPETILFIEIVCLSMLIDKSKRTFYKKMFIFKPKLKFIKISLH